MIFLLGFRIDSKPDLPSGALPQFDSMWIDLQPSNFQKKI